MYVYMCMYFKIHNVLTQPFQIDHVTDAFNLRYAVVVQLQFDQVGEVP